MIIRAALTFGLVWLLMPHHPDLGLTPIVAQDSNGERDAIFTRLREVRSEIAAQNAERGNPVRDEGGTAAQSSSRPIGETARNIILENVLRAIGSRS